MSVVDVKYDSNDLQTASNAAKTIITRDILEKHIGEKIINLKQDTIRDGFDVVDVQYTNKMITLNGWLISNTATALRTWADEFKGYLRPNEKNLDVETYGGSGVYRRYVCSCSSLSIPEEHWQTTQVPYSCEFLCQPFGKATSTTTINLNSGGNITATPHNENVSITGTYKCKPTITITVVSETDLNNENVSITGTYKCKPTITITVVSETDLTAIKFENDTNDDWIQVSRSFAAAEVLVIDCDNETVKVDGTAIDFTGIFPKLDPSTNALVLEVTDSGAFSYTASVSYTSTYL